MTARPSVPRSTRRPPSAANGSRAGRRTVGSSDAAATSTNSRPPSSSDGLAGVAAQPWPGQGLHVLVERGRRRAVVAPGTACRRPRGSGSRRPGRWGRCGRPAGRPPTGRRSPPRSGRSRRQRPSRSGASCGWSSRRWRAGATTPLTMAFSSTTCADRPYGVGDAAICATAPGRGGGEGVAQRVVGVDEGRAGQVQPHHVHQHLVGVRRAIERAGARRVVGRHLGVQQLLAAHLARGIGCAVSAFSALEQARGHRTRRAPGGRQVAEATARRRRSPGTILSQTPSSRTPSNTSCDRAMAVDMAMTSRLNRLSSMPARPWVMPSHMAGTPPATRAIAPTSRAVCLITAG